MNKKEETPFLDPSYIEILNKLLSDLRYGTVSLIVQDGKIIQIEKTEKIRL